MIALWNLHPDLLLIGVDLVEGQALVLSNQSKPVLTTTDLLQVIASHAGPVTGSSGQNRPRFPGEDQDHFATGGLEDQP